MFKARDRDPATQGASATRSDNALADSVNSAYKCELIRGPDQGPWRTVDDVETLSAAFAPRPTEDQCSPPTQTKYVDRSPTELSDTVSSGTPADHSSTTEVPSVA